MLMASCALLAGCAVPSFLLPPTPVPTSVNAIPSKTRRPPTETPLPTANFQARATATPKAAKKASPTPSPTITDTPFDVKATVKIAVHLPLTGDSAAAGNSLYNAARLAVRQLSSPLNQQGIAVELVAFDDQHDVETAVKNANQFTADPGFLCGLGGYNYNVMLQVEDIYHQAGLAFIDPSLTAPGITEKRYLEINRLIGRTDGEGIAAAQFTKAKGFKSVYIISVSPSDGKKNVSGFLNTSAELGLKQAGYTITNLTEGFKTIIGKVTYLKPDVVYFPGSAIQLGNFIREARTAGYQGAFIGSESANNPGFADLAGPLALQGGGTFFTSTSAAPGAYPGATQFVKDYQAAYGANAAMNSNALQAYDALGMCLKAIENIVAKKNGLPRSDQIVLPTRQEVVSAIRAMQDYPGISGTYSFNLRGDPLQVDYFVYQLSTSDPKKWGSNPLVGTFRTAPPL